LVGFKGGLTLLKPGGLLRHELGCLNHVLNSVVLQFVVSC